MAAANAGAIPQSCAKCRRFPALKESWGCLKPLPVAVEELLDDDGNLVPYHSCPMLFIPPVVWEWFERWQYVQKFPHTAPPYDQQDPRFLAFERYYLGRLNDYRARMEQVGGVS